jgi:hypothetical protein
MAETLTVTDNRTGKTYELPISEGTIKAIDLRQIKTDAEDFGLMTYDPAFTNTASCKSRITYIDGDKGILRYRGYPIEQLAEESTYLEAAYLLLFGELFGAGADFQQPQLGGDFLHLPLFLGDATGKVGDFQESHDGAGRHSLPFVAVDLFEEGGRRSADFGPHHGTQLKRPADPVFRLDEKQAGRHRHHNEQPAGGSFVPRAKHVHGLSLRNAFEQIANTNGSHQDHCPGSEQVAPRPQQPECPPHHQS